MDILKWKDGKDVICSKCGKPVYTNQPVYITNTQAIKKRNAYHFICDENSSVAVISQR